MDRLRTSFYNKISEAALGNPPKHWKTIFLFTIGVYFELVEKFVYYLPRTGLYISEHRTWEDINWLVCFDYLGTLLSLLAAPFIDNYRAHQETLLACHGVLSLLSIFHTYTIFFNPRETISQTSLFALGCMTQFTKPIFMSYATLQLPERFGPPSKFLFTAFYTTTTTLLGFIQVAMRWASYKTMSSSIRILSLFLITTYPIVMGVFIGVTILKRYGFSKAESRTGDTILALKCFSRAARHITSGACFENMLNHFDYTTVMNCKRASRVFIILLALSFNSTLLRVMDIPWMFQYFALNRVGLFTVIEFNALCTFITAVLIPVTEYLLIPLIRKIKSASYIPIYSLMISVAYLFTCLSCVLSLWLQTETESAQSTRLDHHNARIYLINCLDTYSYVKAKGFPATRIPSASIKAYLIDDHHPQNGLLRVHFRIFNVFYDINYDLVKGVESKSTTAYVLTMNGAYELSAYGLTRNFFKIESDPSYITCPTLTFVCPKNTSDGDFFAWCKATVKIWIFGGEHRDVVTQELELTEVGNGTVIELPPEGIVSIQMNFRLKFNHDTDIIEFRPLQGAKYVLIVWAGDVHLKIKYRLIPIHTPPKVTANHAIPQIICRALGLSLGLVSLNTLVKINSPHSLYTVTWALYDMSMKIFSPMFMIMNFFSLRNAYYQMPFVIANILIFFALILAIRIART